VIPGSGPHQFRFEENALVDRQQAGACRSLRGLLRVEGMPEPILIAMPMFVIGSVGKPIFISKGMRFPGPCRDVEHCGRRNDPRPQLAARPFASTAKRCRSDSPRGDVIASVHGKLRFSSSALRKSRVLSRGPTAGSSSEQSPPAPLGGSGDSGHTDIWEKPAELNNNANSQTLQDLNLSDDEASQLLKNIKLGDFAQQLGVTAACSDPIESPIVEGDAGRKRVGFGNEARSASRCLHWKIVPTVIDTPSCTGRGNRA